MGRTRKRFNEKGRKSMVSNSEPHLKNECKVHVDFQVKEDQYDESNPLILSRNKKIPRAATKELTVAKKPLSKKQRKKLLNVIERRKKKANRAELLEKLQKVQAKPEELQLLTSTSDMQTHGFKRISEDVCKETTGVSLKLSNIKGSRRKHMLNPAKKLKLDSNTVDCQLSSSETDGSVSDAENDPVEEQVESNVEKSADSIVESSESNVEKSTDSIVENSESGKSSKIEKLVETETERTPVEGTVEQEKMQINRTPAVFVSLSRLPEIQSAREALPIFYEEQTIIEAIREKAVLVIHGETGSGKTTQVPQFLYEAGFTQNNKMIGITEPRRIAAMTMCARVGEELNLPNLVSYHIRYRKTVSEETKIKFMTDGVLLKEIQHDFLLSNYSVILIDEAHERSVFSDVLIGLLSRIVPLRQKRGDPLKLVIMSATMRVQDFTENQRLFKIEPLLIRIDSRQYKVTVHFKKHTPEDYIEAAYQKVCEVHHKEPAGAILVFLTGEKEVNRLCKMLRKTFPFKNKLQYSANDEKVNLSSLENNKSRKKKKNQCSDESFSSLPAKIDLDDFSVEPLNVEDLQHQYSDEEENPDDIEILNYHELENLSPLYTLPLYSILPFEEQEKVFKPPPQGSRLCVVSTNVAETSITIPGLKYVIDSGKVKTKVYNKMAGGISTFSITWCSKASANQRAGRAGRTKEGHCYRLYSSAVFEHDFPDFSPPEIQTIPVDDILLQMKALGIDRVVNFPFPSPPDNDSLKVSERRLVLLGALQDLKKGESYKDIEKWEYSAKVTPLGKAMSRFPLSPRYAKMLILSYKHECVPFVIAIVSALTVSNIFMQSSNAEQSEDCPEEQEERVVGIKNIMPGKGNSLQLGDVMVLLRAVAVFIESKNKFQFCQKHSMRHKSMGEIYKMCLQLCREMNRAFKDLNLPRDFRLEPPTEEQIEKLRKIITTGFTDHVARRVANEEAKLEKSLKNSYRCLDLEEPVFIHPSSVLFSHLPEFVVYQEINHTSKYFMKGCVAIEPEWLPGFAPSLCNFSSPLEDPPPTYNREKDNLFCHVKSTFGRWQWELPCVRMEMPKGLVKYTWFCYFLLDGQVFDFFKTYRAQLLSCPSIMLKTWAKLLPRTRYLLQAIIAKSIDSRSSLKQIWKEDPRYLLREFWEWLPEDIHFEVECNWPPKS